MTETKSTEQYLISKEIGKKLGITYVRNKWGSIRSIRNYQEDGQQLGQAFYVRFYIWLQRKRLGNYAPQNFLEIQPHILLDLITSLRPFLFLYFFGISVKIHIHCRKEEERKKEDRSEHSIPQAFKSSHGCPPHVVGLHACMLWL